MLAGARAEVYDLGILVSDDGDFASVLREVKAMAKTSAFAGFGATRALIKESDVFVRLNRDFLNRV